MNILTSEQPVISRQTVRITDVNYGGHLGHDRLIGLLHQARIDALSAIGASELDFFGTGLILAHLRIDYRAQAFLHEAIDIAVWAENIRRCRFDLHYRARRGDTLIAEALTVMVCFDYGAQQVSAVPRAFAQDRGGV